MTPAQVFKSTLIVLLTLVCAYVLLISIRVILVLLIAIIIASAVRPAVNRLVRWRLPEGAAIVLVYLAIAIMILTLTVAILPPIINQFALYMENDARLAFRIIQAQRWVESTISDVTQNEVSLVAPDEIRGAVSDAVTQVRRVIPSMLSNIGTTLGEAALIFVIGAYWLTSHERATAFITQLSPPFYREKVENMIEEIETTMGSYVRGVVIIASIVGILNFTAMHLVGVPNASALALVIGVTTTIPMIGGLAGGITAVFMTLVADPQYVLFVIVIALVIQQLENYVLTPRIMGGSVGLDPLLIIVYTAVGFVMFGVVGALIAVPVMGTLHILLTYLVIEPYRESIQDFQEENGMLVLKPRANQASQEVLITPERANANLQTENERSNQ